MPQRESIVRKGLGDREPSVKAAAALLVTSWMHDLQPKVKKDDHATKSKVEDEVVSILKLFDLTQDVAVDALLSVFKTKVDLFNNIQFDGEFVI